VAHGEAQLRARWGPDGARVILDTSGTKIWLPGISDPGALETASMLCGTAAMREHGQDYTSRYPVMTPDMIRQLPATRALVVRGGHSPVIAKLPMAWNDSLYRHARHLGHAIAALTPAPEPGPDPRPAGPGTWPPSPRTDGPGRPRPGTRYPWEQPGRPWDTGSWDEEAGPAA
jgi:hypothetical protein